MSNKLHNIQARLTLIMGEIVSVCDEFAYHATPTLVLRHPDGSQASLLLSNDNLNDVIQCIKELGRIGDVSSMSTHEAAIRSVFGGLNE